ncbi:MAG TPA: hypothetical protein VGQ21_00155 [Thermoanaerobaculia bacterium]|jgi:hypothetical protein|nr:hypothetical protein [Thermoanaerobaculia bacterium]
MKKALIAFEHPFFLTLVVLYSAAIGVAFSSFPPVRWPAVSADVFLFAMLFMFVSFIALSYAHAAAAKSYTVGMFSLNASVAVLFAWSFRLLDSAGAALVSGRSPRIPLLSFYLACVALFFTMVLFSKWTKAIITAPVNAHRYEWMRATGIATVMAGSVPEALAPSVHSAAVALRYARGSVATIMLLMSILYFRSEPWELFHPSRSERLRRRQEDS